MADFVYLLQTRLTSSQQQALNLVREVARTKGMTTFLVGGAVRDLISGSPVRDLDVVLQGNATKLKKELQQAKLTLVGESSERQSLYFTMPGGVRIEVGSTLTISYPKPGKPVAKPANILDDLRSRDFTANAMAISLNDGSYGLLMDPLNGVADIENRELRLVSPYGFIEEPARMIRAVRFDARLGFHMEEKTQQRYETGKTEDYIKAMSEASRGYELEEIFHEEDPVRVLRKLEAEGWIKSLFPALAAAKANENELEKVRETSGKLEAMGIHADPSAVNFALITAKLQPKEVSAIKALFPRQGFVEQIAKLDAETKDFTAKFTNKAVAAPSDTWKLLMSSNPEQILSLAYSSKSAPVQNRFNTFYESPQARQRIPYQTMQEMRIVPDLPIYNQLVEDIFFAIMDKKLESIEAIKAFLEPHSPPAPPPPISLRRRAVKKAEKPAKRAKKAAAAVAEVAAPPEAVAVEAVEAPAEKPAAPAKPAKAAKEAPAAKPAPAKAAPAKPAPAKKAEKPAPVAKKAPAPVKKAVAKPAPQKVAAKAKPAPAKKAPAKKLVVVKKAAAKPAPKKPVAKKAPAKPVKKAPAKPAAKKVVVKAKPKKR